MPTNGSYGHGVRDAKVRTGRTINLSDSGGLELWVTASGSKLWTVAYRFKGKQLKLSLGLYPAVGLKDALT
jgi:Arm DNA-binding domain